VSYLDDMLMYRNKERNLQTHWPTALAMILMPLIASIHFATLTVQKKSNSIAYMK